MSEGENEKIRGKEGKGKQKEREEKRMKGDNKKGQKEIRREGIYMLGKIQMKRKNKK